jgi:hypothetical protein
LQEQEHPGKAIMVAKALRLTKVAIRLVAEVVELEVQELLPLTMLVVTVVPGCSTLGSQQFLPLPMDGLAVAAEAAVPTF